MAVLSVSPAAGEIERGNITEVRQSGEAVIGEDQLQAPAPPELNEGSSLDHYLRYAALHNTELEAAFNRWKASLEKVPQVQSLPDPRFSYTYYIENINTGVIPESNKFNVEQMFPWFGTLDLHKEVALKESQEFREQFEALKTNLFYRVKLAYFEYYYLTRAIEITHKNLELMTVIEHNARIRYIAGKASYADVIKAQVQIAKLEEQLVGLNDMKNPLIAEFNALLNRAIDEYLPAPALIPDYVLTRTEESLYRLMREKNPELREFDIRIARETDTINLAKKQFYPDFTVGLDYEKVNARMSGESDSGMNPLMAMFGVTIPLWRNKYRAAVREAEITRTTAVSSLNSRENSLDAALNRALYNYRDARRKIGLYRDVLIPKAQESLDVSTLAYVAGTADFLDLLDAQSTLLDLEMMYERMLSNHAQYFSELEMLVGQDLTDKKI